MSNKKQVIRITESELKTIIDKSVQVILEGQGWNYFKNHMKQLGDATPEERQEMEKQMRDPRYKYNERGQFVGNGDFNGRANFYGKNEHNFYDKDGNATQNPNDKPINKNLSGRLGRFAGAKGAEYATRAVNKMQKFVDTVSDPDKNPLSPFSKEGPKPFDENTKPKKIVKITENDLHNMIREAVNQVMLSELDWKTYMSAAEKDKDPRRAIRLKNHAVDTFNKKFGYESPEEEGGINGPESTYMLGNGNLYHKSRGVDDRFNYHHQFVTPADGDADDELPTSQTTRGYGRSTSQGYVKRPYTSSKPHARAMQKAADEHNAWRKDEYTYNKGLGYHNTNNKTDWHDYLWHNNK